MPRALPVLLLASRMAFSVTPPDDPAILNNLGSRLYAEGNYREAETHLARAVALWSEQQPPEFEVALHNLAAVYRLEGRYAEALPLYERAIRLREARSGATDLGLLLPLNGLALLYLDMGEVKQSKATADRAISIAGLHRREQTPDAASDFSALGSILAAQSRYSEAKSWIGWALGLRNRLFGPDSVESAGAWMDLALVCRRERRLDDAARAYRQALHIYREGEEAGPAANALSGLASLLSAQHHYGEAGALLEEAIAMLEKAASPALPATGQLKSELGDVRFAQKQTAEAVKLYREALGILEPALGSENPRLLPVLESYAKALRAQQDYAGAASIDFRTMKIRVKQTLGRRPPNGATQDCDSGYSGFRNRLSNAARASFGLRGAGVFDAEPLEGRLALGCGVSRATVIRGLKSSHSFAWSFTAIRTGMGFWHWKRVDGSK